MQRREFLKMLAAMPLLGDLAELVDLRLAVEIQEAPCEQLPPIFEIPFEVTPEAPDPLDFLAHGMMVHIVAVGDGDGWLYYGGAQQRLDFGFRLRVPNLYPGYMKFGDGLPGGGKLCCLDSERIVGFVTARAFRCDVIRGRQIKGK